MEIALQFNFFCVDHAELGFGAYAAADEGGVVEGEVESSISQSECGRYDESV